VRYIRQDYFVKHPYLSPILSHLHKLITSPSSRVCGIGVFGEPNSGKTTLGAEIERKYCQDDDKTRATHPRRTALNISLTAAINARLVFERIIGACHGPVSGLGKYKDGDQRLIVDLLKQLGTRLLLLDEFTDILLASPLEQKRVLSAIKFIMVNCKIVVVALGTSSSKPVFIYDSHMKERFTRFELPAWRVNKALQVFLLGLQNNLPLRKASSLLAYETMMTLISVSGGITGRITDLIKDAAVKAIQTQCESIDINLINDVARNPVDYSKYK